MLAWDFSLPKGISGLPCRSRPESHPAFERILEEHPEIGTRLVREAFDEWEYGLQIEPASLRLQDSGLAVLYLKRQPVGYGFIQKIDTIVREVERSLETRSPSDIVDSVFLKFQSYLEGRFAASGINDYPSRKDTSGMDDREFLDYIKQQMVFAEVCAYSMYAADFCGMDICVRDLKRLCSLAESAFERDPELSGKTCGIGTNSYGGIVKEARRLCEASERQDSSELKRYDIRHVSRLHMLGEGVQAGQSPRPEGRGL